MLHASMLCKDRQAASQGLSVTSVCTYLHKEKVRTTLSSPWVMLKEQSYHCLPAWTTACMPACLVRENLVLCQTRNCPCSSDVQKPAKHLQQQLTIPGRSISPHVIGCTALVVLANRANHGGDSGQNDNGVAEGW